MGVSSGDRAAMRAKTVIPFPKKKEPEGADLLCRFCDKPFNVGDIVNTVSMGRVKITRGRLEEEDGHYTAGFNWVTERLVTMICDDCLVRSTVEEEQPRNE